MPATPSPWSHKAFDRNPGKNRFKDVLCYDETRIELKDGESNYIHANEVHLPGDGLRYVLTQAPMKKTVADFWRMIWQLKPLTVAILSQPLRDEERYLPDIRKSAKYGKIEVTRSVEVDSNDWWTITECTVVLTADEEDDASVEDSFIMRFVIWYEWTQDADIPRPDRFLSFVQELHIQIDQEASKEDRSNQSKADIVLVCPTGSIRSGLVAAASALVRVVTDELYNPDQVDRVMKELRECRHRTIDRFSQYTYLFWFVLQTIQETPDMTIPANATESLPEAMATAQEIFEKANRDEKLAALH